MNLDNDEWNARREQLENELIKSCLNLCAHTGAGGFEIPIERESAFVLKLVRTGEKPS